MGHTMHHFIRNCTTRLARAGWLSAIIVLGFTGVAGVDAQTVFPYPHTVTVGGSDTEPVTIQITQSGTATAATVLTGGAPNLDYTLVAGGSCGSGTAYTAGATCTVAVSFAPRFPGARHGAVLLVDGGGNALGEAYLEGSATGSLSVLTPGLMTTVAGDAQWIYSGDNHPATQSAIFLPQGEVADPAGNLYIADTNNNRVRRVDAITGLMTTVLGGNNAGYSGDNGPGTSALVNAPYSLAIDGAGNLFIGDSGNYVVRMLSTLTGTVTTIAGTGGAGGTPGDNGPASLAHLSGVGGLAVDSLHRLVIADTGNNTIRRIDLQTGIITRLAGQYVAAFSGDNGPALSATFNAPEGINFGPDGSLYVGDVNNARVRKIDPNGIVTTVAGGGSDLQSSGIPAGNAQLALPAGVALDAAGNLYIADAGSNRIRKVAATTGFISTVAGNGAQQFAGDGGNADKAQIYGPSSVFYDGQGNLYFGDFFNNRIRKVNGSLAAFRYAAIRVNRTSAPQMEQMEDDGNAALALSAPVLSNTSLDPATTTCVLPGSLATGASCMLGVAFSPTVLGNPAVGSVTLPSDAGNSPSLIGVSGQSLSVDPTATTLSSNVNPSGFNLPVTFTAHVTTQGTNVTGTVNFLDGATVIGSGTLNGSHLATFTTSILGPGPHIITGAYQGDATNASSLSSALIQSVKQVATAVLQSSANPSYATQSITLTATVTGHGTVPTGTVVFKSDGATLGTVALDGFGIATWTTSTLTIGQHALVAAYQGDATNSAGQSNTVPQVVQGQASTTALIASAASIPVGTAVTFSVQVTGSNTTIASGTVAFKEGATTVGTATLDATGAASFSTTAFPPGQHTIVAVYAGDANYASSTSSAVVETVQQLATATVVTASANPASAGASLTLSVSVGVSSGTATGGVIAGTVTFLKNGVAVGSSRLAPNGIGTLSLTTLPLGPSTITAQYAASTNYLGSTSAPLVETVVQATTATALATSLTPSVAEDAITLTATVTGTGGTPYGAVTFFDGQATLGQGTLDAHGVATLSTSALTVGLHPLTATYDGDTLDQTSTSVPLGQTVLHRPTADVLTSSATSLTGGQQVTLISVVQWTGAIVPTGTTVFTSGETMLGTSVVDGTGVATLTINPQIGLTDVVATYSGDGTYEGSASTNVEISVGEPALFTVGVDKAAMTVKRLDHTTVNFTIGSVRGFADDFKLGCLGLPFAATCTFSVDQASLAAGGSQTVQITVDTGSPLTAGPLAHLERRPGDTLLALCWLPAGALLLLFRRRLSLPAMRLLLALCLLGTMAGLSGCGALTVNGTPPGTYHFQITAAAQGANVLEAVDMTLTVTP